MSDPRRFSILSILLLVAACLVCGGCAYDYAERKNDSPTRQERRQDTKIVEIEESNDETDSADDQIDSQEADSDDEDSTSAGDDGAP